MRLSPFSPYLPRYPGPYGVGTIELEVPVAKEAQRTFGGTNTVKTLLVRLFYPTAATHGTQPRWIGHGGYSIQGYAKFLGIKASILRAASLLGLKWTQIPALENAPLLSPVLQSQNGKEGSETSRESEKWPCMVFSHGLGGTRNAYSQICGSIASGGLVVMAIEHRDNSAAISLVHHRDTVKGQDENVHGEQGGQETGNGEQGEDEVVEYIAIQDSSAQSIAKRRAQVAQREYEVRLGVELLRTLNGNVSTQQQDILTLNRVQKEQLGSFVNSMKCASGEIVMAGHSFGAATAVHCAKSSTLHLPRDGQGDGLANAFCALLLLDVWTQVLVDSRETRLNVPTLCIASQAFHQWSSNWQDVQHLLKHGKEGNVLCWVRESAHLSQSDFQLLFPMATRVAFKAHIDPHLAMSLNVRAMREFLRRQGIGREEADPDIFTKSDQELVVVDL